MILNSMTINYFNKKTKYDWHKVMITTVNKEQQRDELSEMVTQFLANKKSKRKNTKNHHTHPNADHFCKEKDVGPKGSRPNQAEFRSRSRTKQTEPWSKSVFNWSEPDPNPQLAKSRSDLKWQCKTMVAHISKWAYTQIRSKSRARRYSKKKNVGVIGFL